MKTIRLSKSSISQAEKDAVMAVLDHEFLGMGAEVQAFESEIAEYIGVEPFEVVCVNTGTSALQLAVSGLDIGPGDEVLVPSLTYVASYQAISATGAKPVSVDVLEDTLFIDMQDAKNRVSPNTKAIMPVHYASDSKSMELVYEFAHLHGLRVIEDAAHSFGCVRNGKKVGSIGDVICFSFDGIKNITSGEGGAVVTKDSALLERLKDGRLLGVQKDTERRFKGERSWDFDVSHQGYRFHMSNIFAAIGREQLKRIEEFKGKRQKIAQYYCERLSLIEGVELLDLAWTENVPHIFVIKVLNGKRDAMMEALRNNGIQCGIHYKPNHQLTLYKTDYALPVVDKLAKEILTIPLHADLTEQEVDYVVSNIDLFLRGN